MAQTVKDLASGIPGLVRFIFVTGSVGLDAFLLLAGGLILYSIFVPRPAFIYEGVNDFGSSLIAFYYPQLLWFLLVTLAVVSASMIIRGAKNGAASAREYYVVRHGVNVRPPWWDVIRVQPFWQQLISWSLKGVVFGYLAYQGILHEWAERPWF